MSCSYQGMTREEIIERYFDGDEVKPFFYEGFDDAILGVTQRMNQEPLVTYSVDKMIDIMVKRDHMSYEEAIEFFDYNIGGGWIGEKTPMFIRNEY